jgi:hypothetical protein
MGNGDTQKLEHSGRWAYNYAGMTDIRGRRLQSRKDLELELKPAKTMENMKATLMR